MVATNFNLLTLCLMLTPVLPILGVVFAIIGIIRREGL
jgi:hypothetical protein